MLVQYRCLRVRASAHQQPQSGQRERHALQGRASAVRGAHQCHRAAGYQSSNFFRNWIFPEFCQFLSEIWGVSFFFLAETVNWVMLQIVILFFLPLAMAGESRLQEEGARESSWPLSSWLQESGWGSFQACMNSLVPICGWRVFRLTLLLPHNWVGFLEYDGDFSLDSAWIWYAQDL